MSSRVPPLPEGMDRWEVTVVSSRATETVITEHDAAKLLRVSLGTIKGWVADGRVRMCYTPEGHVRVFVASVWEQIPAAVQRER